MAKSTNRYFQFLGPAKKAQVSGRLWYPAADVYTTSEGWVVKVELAGVSVEDVEIDIQGNTLMIAGCRKDRTCTAGITYQQMEITYSSFEKTLRFPGAIDGVKLDHMFDNGLLIIHLHKGK
jgi:HSP20 family protein